MPSNVPILARLVRGQVANGPLRKRDGARAAGSSRGAGVCSSGAARGALLEVAPADALSLFDHFNPGASLGARGKRILEADFAHPSWELAMARKDARLMLDEAARVDVPLAVLPAIAAEMDRFLARGHAHDDWSVMAKDALARAP